MRWRRRLATFLSDGCRSPASAAAVGVSHADAERPLVAAAASAAGGPGVSAEQGSLVPGARMLGGRATMLASRQLGRDGGGGGGALAKTRFLGKHSSVAARPQWRVQSGQQGAAARKPVTIF